MGIQNVHSHLATALRTGVVALFAWLMVLLVGSGRTIGQINGQTWVFLILSGLATGGSWLCYYRALQLGPASAVVPIDKLSILVTVAFSCLVLKERLRPRAWLGLALLVSGTLLMLFVF